MSVMVTYRVGGASTWVTTTVPTNKSGTLPCKGKLFNGDIQLAFVDYGGYVQYDGVSTAASAGTIAVLPCSGMVAKTDIIVMSSTISPASEDSEISEQNLEESTALQINEIDEQSLEENDGTSEVESDEVV